ncbi:MAG: DUF6159 family protein [Acidimicrobiales bacterium]
MGRIKNTWSLAKVSWAVLRQDRELLLIPVLSFVSALVVLGALLIPTIALLDTGSAEESSNPALVVLGIVAALAMSIISVFFNGALVAGAHERMSGGDPTVGSAMRRATARLGGLLPWALLTGTVGLVLQAVRERAGFIGSFIVNLAGAAWEVVTFLVVPAIVIDDHSAVDGLKRSGALLKATWGENLAARVGFGLLGLLAMIPAVVLVAVMSALGSAALVVGVGVAVIYVAVVIVVLTALNAVFQTALYLYATTGSVPSGYEHSNLPESFTRK